MKGSFGAVDVRDAHIQLQGSSSKGLRAYLTSTLAAGEGSADKSKETPGSDFKADSQLSQEDVLNIFSKALGTAVQLRAQARIVLDEEGQMAVDDIHVEGGSDLLQFTANGLLTAYHQLVMTSPIDVHYKLNSGSLDPLKGGYFSQLKLLKPVDIQGSIHLEPVSLDNFSLGQLHIKGALQIPEVLAQGSDLAKVVALHAVSATCALNGKTERLHMDVSGTSFVGATSQKGNIEAHIDVDGLFSPFFEAATPSAPTLTFKGQGKVTHFPLAFLAPFLDQLEWQGLFGDAVDIEVSAQASVQAPVTFNVQLKGDAWQAKGEFELGESGSLKILPEVAHITWTLTPQRFAKLYGRFSIPHSPIVLQRSVDLVLQTKDLQIPFISTPSAFAAGYSPQMHLEISAPGGLSLYDSEKKQALDFNQLQVELKSADVTKSVAYAIKAQGAILGSLQGKGQSSGSSDAHPEMHLDVTGTAENWLPQKSSAEASQSAFHALIHTKAFPVAWMCSLAGMSHQVQAQAVALIGRSLDADLSAAFQAGETSLKGVCVGSHGSMLLDGKLVNGFLLLNAPLEAYLTPSPELSQTVLQDVIPVFSSMSVGEHPIKIEIENQGFAFPIAEFLEGEADVRSISLPRAVLSLGKLSFSNAGQLGQLFALLDTQKRGVASSMHTVWFTPLYFGMQEGSIKCERIDMLIDNRFPIAFWGKVNLVEDSVKMMIGLTAEALKNALGISGLKSDYMMLLPLRGSIAKASVDKDKATARITALIMHSQGGPHGLIIGTLLDILNGGSNQGDIPPPTTQPLPWMASAEANPAKNVPPPKKGRPVKRAKALFDGLQDGLQSEVESILKIFK